LLYFLSLNQKVLVFPVYLLVMIIWKGSEFPQLANHSVLLVFLCIYLFLVSLKSIWLKKDLKKNIYESKKYLGLYLAWVYFMAGFHKLNYDFITPDSSCANWYHYKLNRYLNLDVQFPNILKNISSYMAIGTEIFGAALLLFVPMLGLIGFLFLHSYLSIGGFADFAAIACSVLVIFLPDKAINHLVKIRAGAVFLTCAIGSALMTYLRYYELALTDLPFLRIRFMQGGWLIASISLLFYVIFRYRENLFTRSRQSFKFISVEGLLLAILMVYSFNPYLGLSTSGSFTMFSNLRTEENKTNHLFVPNKQLFNYQKNTVLVVAVEPDYQEWYFKKDMKMPTIHFKKIFKDFLKTNQENFKIILKTESGLKYLTQNNINKEDWLSDSFIEDHYLNFRAYDPIKSNNYCRW